MNKVKTGFFAVTEVNDPDGHVEYNWWHSRDHQPENMALDGVVLATRWAAPQRYMDARLQVHPDFKGHQYLVHYLMTGPSEEVLREFSDLGARTRALGRFFGPRTIVAAGHFDLVKGYVAPRMEIAPEALPFRPNDGVFIVIRDITDPKRYQEIARWYDEVHIPDLVSVDGVMGCYWFKARPTLHPMANDAIGSPADRHVWVYYLDRDPLAATESIRSAMGDLRKRGRILDMTGAAETLLAAPYMNIRDPRNFDWHTV